MLRRIVTVLGVLAVALLLSGCSANQVRLFFLLYGENLDYATAFAIAESVNEGQRAACDPAYSHYGPNFRYCVPDNQADIDCAEALDHPELAARHRDGPVYLPRGTYVDTYQWDHYELEGTHAHGGCAFDTRF